MYICKDTKKVVLRLRDPQKVLAVLPTAKLLTVEGKEHVAIPHRGDETRVLRNLGFDVPAPITQHYQWPGRFKPFHAQLETASFLTLNPKGFVLNDMGTGKTLSVLWAWHYLYKVRRAKKLLVVAPLSTLERTWADEVFTHFLDVKVGVLHGTKERRLKILASDCDIYLINHDGLSVIEAALVARQDIDTVVVDESAAYRSAPTKRWKCLSRILAGRTRTWLLTGTPTPNAPTDAWAQARLVVPERVPKHFGAFRDQCMKPSGPFGWVARDGANDIVRQALQPSVRFSRDQCVDLPPVQYLDRHVDLTREQMTAYKAMAAHLYAQVANGTVAAANAAVQMSKLIQIACGVVYDVDGTAQVLPNDPRIDLVEEIIEASGTKTIVFVPFKAVIARTAELLTARKHSVAVISGDVPKGQRDEIFRAFQQDSQPRVLVAQPAAMSHGLTLTAASTIAWYAPVTSNEIYQQACARITRPGQKHSQLIVNIEACAVERKIYSRLAAKQNVQEALLDILRNA